MSSDFEPSGKKVLPFTSMMSLITWRDIPNLGIILWGQRRDEPREGLRAVIIRSDLSDEVFISTSRYHIISRSCVQLHHY